MVSDRKRRNIAHKQGGHEKIEPMLQNRTEQAPTANKLVSKSVSG